MTNVSPARPLWLEQAEHKLQTLSGVARESVQQGLQRLRRRSDGSGPYHIDAYRGMLDDAGCSVSGRVLRRPLTGGPRENDDWWDNLLNSYRRFDSEHMAGVSLDVSFRGQTATTVSDAEGYYEVQIPLPKSPCHDLWETAEVSRSEGGPVFLQPILCVPDKAAFGLISDIDDTVLESNITGWQTAVQLAFLSNAQTRKPLEGVAKLYQAFQRGHDGAGPNPIFYVSASPWNLYDLLQDFFDLNGIPPGPIQLRDLDFSYASVKHNAGPHSKLAKIHGLIERYPAMRWVLVGDSSQIDAELYAGTVRKFPGRIIAVYIRDVDPASDSVHDKFVDARIQDIADSGVPMLRVTDSNAIADHARKLGLIDPEEIAVVAKDVQRDQDRPDVKHAVKEIVEAAADKAKGAAAPASAREH